MNWAYVGQLESGSTSAMRLDALVEQIGAKPKIIIDISQELRSDFFVWRWLAWRFKTGPTVRRIGKRILRELGDDELDMCWFDKASFVPLEAIVFARKRARKMVHYTPDPAIVFHKSRDFVQAIPHFDFLITTKSYEKHLYKQLKSSKGIVILTQQGIDDSVHKNYVPFKQKQKAVSFIGHAEPNRMQVVDRLLRSGIPVHLAGRGWKSYAAIRNKRFAGQLLYAGEGLYGEEYGQFLSSCLISLGFLSRLVPDRITTRTFEIPACGSLLVTERTDEIESIFSEDEVLYCDYDDNLVDMIKQKMADLEEVEDMIMKSMTKVHAHYTWRRLMGELVCEVQK